MHAVLLGTGVILGLFGAGSSTPVARPWSATLEAASESALEPDPREELEPVLADELEEPELVQLLAWAVERPEEPRPWEVELRPLDLEPPDLFELRDLALSGGGAGTNEAGAGAGAGEPPAREEPRVVAPPAPTATVVEEPRLVEGPPPDYPRVSVRAGEEGTVVCRLHISEAGVVSQVEVARSSGFERLDRAATEALSHWRFEPRRSDGRPVPATLLHQVTFRLQS